MQNNPYHPMLPPDDPTLFFGRQTAIAFLRQNLVGANNQHIISIFGRLGIGKTALLNHIPSIVDERYNPVYIAISAEETTSLARLIHTIANAVVAYMEKAGASTYRIPVFPAENSPDAVWLTWFKESFLDIAVVAIRRDNYLLLMLDDFHLLLQAIQRGDLPASIIDYLAELLQTYERLDIVAGVDIRYEQQMLSYPLTAHMNLHLRLDVLPQEDAYRLITEPVQEQYIYTPEAIQRIQFLCGGNPFLIHSVCRLLYRFYEERTGLNRMTVDLVERVYEPALIETGEIMQDFWDRITPNMQQTLRALLGTDPHSPTPVKDLLAWLAQAGYPLNQTQLQARLRELEYEALIYSNADGDFLFHTGLEAAWLEQHLSELPTAAPRLPNRNQLLGMAATLIAVLAVIAFALSGVFGDDDSDGEDAPDVATITFEVDLEASRQAEADTATALAIPSDTPTPSQTPSITPSSTASETPLPTDTPSRTPSPTRTATPIPTPEGVPGWLGSP